MTNYLVILFGLIGLQVGVAAAEPLNSSTEMTVPSALPPEVVYHYGPRKFLEKDAAANNVPQEDWDKFIMGGSGNWTLAPFRRGLYVGTKLSGFEVFGEWFMAVHLAPTCLNAHEVYIPSELPIDPRFIAWSKTSSGFDFKNLDEFIGKCYRKTNAQLGYPGPWAAELRNRDGTEEGTCEKTVHSFYEEAHAKIVLDEQFPSDDDVEVNLREHSSWYIRERSCITGIESRPDQVIALFARHGLIWREAPSQVSLRMFVTALAEVPDAGSFADLETNRQDALLSKANWYARPKSEKQRESFGPSQFVTSAIEAVLRCRKSGAAGMQEIQSIGRAALALSALNLKSAKSFAEQQESLAKACQTILPDLKKACGS